MAIEAVHSGVWTPQQPEVIRPARELHFRPGTPDVSEAVGVSMELLGYLGGVTDANRETTQQQVEAEFTEKAALGYDGRLFVLPDGGRVPFEALLAGAEGLKPSEIDERFRWDPLWRPGTEAESFTKKDLDGAKTETVTRLAVFSSVETGLDPLLHHLNLPYDNYAKNKWNPDAETTQLEEIAADQAEFADRHEDFMVEMPGPRSYLVWAIMDRIRGRKADAPNYVDPRSQEFVLNRGWMRVSEEMGRRAVGGGSVVGRVYSVGGQLRLVGSAGSAGGDVGVGVSVGRKESAPEAA